MAKAKKKKEPEQKVCPCCGRCPVCGRTPNTFYPYPYYPWQTTPVQPYYYWSGGTVVTTSGIDAIPFTLADACANTQAT